MIKPSSVRCVIGAISCLLVACGSGTDSNGQTGGGGGSTQGGAAGSGVSGASGAAGAPPAGAGASATGGAASPNGGAGGSSDSNGGLGGSSEAMAGATHSAGSGGTAGGSHAGGASNSGGSHAGGASNSGGASNNAGASNVGGSAGSASSLPAKVVAGYYPNWTPSPVRIKDVESHYNLIYLFAATPVGGAPGTTGAITWTSPGDGQGAATNLKADIAYARATQQRKILLSIGGAGNGMSFPTRAKSQAFVDSVASWYDKLGGIDGIDWNTFEGNQAPDTQEMIWISLQLKARYSGFIISAPPAPWNSVDQTFCAAMVKAGALDYAAPQYYDGPNLATQSYMVTNVATWVKLLGASKVVVGFGIWDQPNYMSIGDAVATWKALEMASPALRGAFDWQIHTDQAQGWPFATQLAPLVE